jgi:hypothetical protein
MFCAFDLHAKPCSQTGTSESAIDYEKSFARVFFVLRLRALAKAEDDRRGFGAFEKRAREQGSRPTI